VSTVIPLINSSSQRFQTIVIVTFMFDAAKSLRIN